MAPLAVVVSGVPGGGKTTLARQLADHLRIPHLNKDIIRDGLWFTARGRQSDLNDRAFALFLGVIESWLAADVSLVADQTLYRGVSESDMRRVLGPAAAVNVHVRTTLARERFHGKMTADPRNDGASVEAMMQRWEDIFHVVAEPLDLGCPIIEIDTSDPVDIEGLAAAVVTAARR